MRISIRFMNNTHNATDNSTSSPYRMNDSTNIYSLIQIFKITFRCVFYVWWRKPRAKLCSTNIM